MESLDKASQAALHHGLFYMENAGGYHEQQSGEGGVAEEHQPSCFALEEEKGADYKGLGKARPVINDVRPTL